MDTPTCAGSADGIVKTNIDATSISNPKNRAVRMFLSASRSNLNA
jgi:hypothetical protein